MGPEDLQQHEQRAGDGQRAAEGITALDGADQPAHGDAEHRRQDAAEDETDPPGESPAPAPPSAGRRRTSTPCAR
jgi:hypothetical protein